MKLLKILLPSVFILAFMASCGVTTNFFTNPGSKITSQQSSLFAILLIIGAVVFIIVEGGIIFAVVRYRHRKDDANEPKQVHGSVPLEIIWTAIPVLLVVAIFILNINTMNGIAAPPPSGDDVKVNVIGHQWWWEFNYPDQKITTANELYIPVGRPIQITLTSVDVVHSFWITQLAGKTDVVPGQTNHMWFEADQIGVYDGQCAEFCGIEHAMMRMKVVAVSAADFDAWIKSQQTLPPPPVTPGEINGQKLVVSGVCAACHTIDGTMAKGKIGPNLTHLWSRSTFAGGVFPMNMGYMTDWVKDARSMKPGNLMAIQVPDQQLLDILAYLSTLR